MPALAVAQTAAHEGVASCAGSTCHGATKAFDGRGIRQDEYFTWQRRDRHARAYSTLLGARSQAISSRLGWGRAEQAEGCLSCHSDAVAEKQRGERFLLSDGVGCEACHGGAGNWLETHAQGYKTSEQRHAAGLYPLWEPGPRAALCLSCHQGDAQRRMSHAVMAAGHPPLLFELDTFTQLQPAHFDADADYRARKPAPASSLNWLAGQIAAAGLYLDRLASSTPTPGIFPELSLFECDACHHSMSAARSDERRSGGQAAGSVPLADSALLMLKHWQEATGGGNAWTQAWRGLHAAAGQGDSELLRVRAADMKALLPPAESADAERLRRFMRQISSEASRYTDGSFGYAEQAAMALSVSAAALEQMGQPPTPALREAIQQVYSAVENRDRYAPERFRAALARLHKTISP